MFLMRFQQFSLCSDPAWHWVFFLCLSHLQSLCSTGALKSSERGGMDSSHTWPPPVDHECSQWHYKWQSLSMKFSTWFDALEKALSVLATTFKMYFLNKLQKLKITVWSLGHRIGAMRINRKESQSAPKSGCTSLLGLLGGQVSSDKF